MRNPKTLIAAAILAGFVSPALASANDAAALAPLRQFINDQNKGDVKGAEAAFAPGAIIIDEFSPFRWRGKHLVERWGADFGKMAKSAGITSPSLKDQEPTRITVDGDQAYAVVPAELHFLLKGKAETERGLLTVVTKKTSDGWKIADFTYSPE